MCGLEVGQVMMPMRYYRMGRPDVCTYHSVIRSSGTTKRHTDPLVNQPNMAIKSDDLFCFEVGSHQVP